MDNNLLLEEKEVDFKFVGRFVCHMARGAGIRAWTCPLLTLSASINDLRNQIKDLLSYTCC